MSGDQARQHGPHDPDRAGRRQDALALQDRREVLPFDERHRDVLDAVDLAEVVDPHDVRVRHLACEQQFPFEPSFQVLCGRRVCCDLGAHDLERDSHTKLGVPRLVDRAHAPHAQQPDDVIPGPELGADLQRSARRGSRWSRQTRGHVVARGSRLGRAGWSVVGLVGRERRGQGAARERRTVQRARRRCRAAGGDRLDDNRARTNGAGGRRADGEPRGTREPGITAAAAFCRRWILRAAGRAQHRRFARSRLYTRHGCRVVPRPVYHWPCMPSALHLLAKPTGAACRMKQLTL